MDGRWEVTRRTLVFVGVMIVAISLGYLDVIAPWNWIDTSNATSVQAWAAVAQAFFAAVLFLITVYYTRVTREMASVNKDMALLQQRQQLDSTLPVIVLRLGEDEHARVDMFTLYLFNAGTGPALDVNVELRNLKVNYDLSKLAPLPVTIPSGSENWFYLEFDTDRPFDPTFSTAAFSELQPPQDDGGALAAWQQRRMNFDVRVRTLAGTLTSVGTVVVSYRDIHGRTLESAADLVVGKVESEHEWPNVWLGAMRFMRPG